MAIKLKSIFGLLKETASDWVEDKAPRLGAALAYYTVFSISPLVIIVIAIAGIWFGQATAREQILGEINNLVGAQGGKAIQSILESAQKPEQGIVATVIATFTLLLGATGVFVQLQDALNTIWEAEPKAGSGLWGFVKDRMLSFAMILGIGFLLLISLILSAGLTALGTYMRGILPGINILWQVLNFLVSLGLITVLFAMIFKFIPDVKVAWHDVWIGAVLTALLFNVGKFLLGMYLAKSSAASAYGAAGSIVIILLWVFYSSQILFFGAEFTQVYANKYGSRLAPSASPEPVRHEAAAPSPAAPAAAISAPAARTLERPVATPTRKTHSNDFRPKRRNLGVALLFMAACFGSAKLLENALKKQSLKLAKRITSF